MKKLIYGAFFVSILAFFSVSVAQDLPRLFSGRIQTVDNASETIAVRTGDNTMAFQISRETRIKTDFGEDVPFNQLKATMSVVVEYMKEGDTIHPFSIKVNTLPSGYASNRKLQQLCGVIQTVEEGGRNIVVTDGQKTMAFHISQDTKTNVPISDLKSGTRVKIDYLYKGAINQTLSINAKAKSKGTGKKQTAGNK